MSDRATGAASAPSSARDPGLWGALGVGLLVRGALLSLYPHTPAIADEQLHYATGVLVSELGMRAFGHWVPGYETLLAAVFAFSGPDPVAVKCVQIGLSLALVALVYGIARRTGDIRAARIAAWLTALDPTFAAYTHYLFSETLFLTLLTAALYTIARDPEGRSASNRIVTGLLFGLTALTRGVVLYFLPLWVVWEWIRGRRPQAAHAAGIFAIALAVVMPWTLRNAAKYHAFQLTDGTLGITAYFAFSEVPLNQDLGFKKLRPRRSREPCPSEILAHVEPLPLTPELRPLFPSDATRVMRSERALLRTIGAVRRYAMVDHAARQSCELKNALGFAREHPGVLTTQILRRFYDFWGPNSFLLRSIRSDVYPAGPLAAESYPLVKLYFLLGYLPVIAAAILAFGRRELPYFTRWSGLFLLYYTAIHMLAVAFSRYRLPVMPIVIVLASQWFAQPRLPEGRVRRIAVSAALAGFSLLSAIYLGVHLP